jgi:hypothetical protein
LYLPKYIYSNIDNLVLLLLSWLVQYCLTFLRCIFQSL